MSRSTKQSGQALVEAGLLLPLLVFMLVAVGFLGLAIYERQNVLIAARFAAREASMNAMARGKADILLGAGVLRESTAANLRKTYARQVLGAKRELAVNAPEWRYESDVRHQKLSRTVALGPYGRAYVAKNPTGEFGLGFVMYGQSLTSKSGWLNAMGAGLNESSGLVSDRPKRLWDGPGVRAEGYMPGELPIHGKGVGGDIGLMELNPWIKRILSE